MAKKENNEDVLVVKKPIKIDAGKHDGKIVNVIRNPPSDENPYDYIDVFFEVSDVDETPELRVGFPANISELSTLGKVLKKAGMDFIENEEIKVKDIKDLLMDREVTFLINNEKTDAGEFARILRDTIEFN